MTYQTRLTKIAQALILLVPLAGCAIPEPHAAAPVEQGLRSYPTRWNGGIDDINGEVGHPIYVSNPRANCSDGGWNADMGIESGSLPPGLSMVEHSAISGIPTERGHWVVKVYLRNLQCAGKTYSSTDFIQDLRFHITGTGAVHQ